MAAGRARDELLLGIDVGTTSCKAAVVSLAGAELAHGRAPVEWQRVPTGAEIAPAGIVAAAVAAGEAALAGVLLDRAGEPLAPAIAWHDARGGEEAARLAADLGAERFSERTGLAPRPLCSAVKLRWLRAHHPDTARAVRWLNVAEWVVRELGGEELAELSLASRTGWLDIHARRWWEEALEWSGASAALLPELVPAGTPAGSAGDALPRARGAVLAIGGHDHLSAAVGAGAIGDGDVLDSCGTAEAFIRATAPLPPDRVREAVALGIN